jgi:hypothetical protein
MIQNLPQAQNASEPTVKRRFNMFALSKKLGFAAVGTLVVLGGYGLPAGANDLTEALGPVRVTLDPRQVVHIETAQNRTLGLQCGSAADTLAIVDTGKMYTAGAAE